MGRKQNININNEKILNLVVNGLLEEGEEVIFIFGAGPSLSSGIPGGRFLKEKLKVFLTTLKETKKVMDALKEIPEKFKGKDLDETFKKAPLECLISVGCRSFREEIMIEWLKRYIPDVYKSKIRFFPSIAYEFVSHLMSNRLIKYVVNLNYDELLDKTIEDELGPNKCYRVATIEDFERIRREHSWERISQFFIFKPHGTISLPMSLIHKYEETLEFEEQKADVLRRLFKNKILVLVGYEANDEDFRLLLNEQLLLNHIAKIIVVKGDPSTALQRLPLSEDVLGYSGRDEFFEELARKLHEHEKYKGIYTKATEHLIRCRIYNKLSPEDPSDPKYNLKLRKFGEVVEKDPLFFTRLNLLLEILIFCFKTRGLFANTALMSYTRVVSALKEHLKALEERLSEGKKKEGGTEIGKVLDQLVEKDNNDKKKILRKRPINRGFESYWYYLPLPKNIDEKMTIDKEKIKDLYKNSAEKALEILNKEYLKKLGYPLTNKDIGDLKEEFYKLQQDFDYEIGDEHTPYILFQDPLLLKDRKEFQQKGLGILRPKESGSTLYIISLTGEWLKGAEISNIEEVKIITNKGINIEDSIHYKNVCLFKRELEQELKKRIKAEFEEDTVDHYMTIRFKREREEIKGEAVYFYRPGKTPLFAPFYLKDEKDIKRLVEFFGTLWGELTSKRPT